MYLGVDLGTSSLKIVLADAKGGIIDSVRREYPVSYPKAGWSEQNPDDWFDALLSALKELKTRHDIGKIRAVSFCGQMHGLVILDKDDKVIRPAILWNDSRTINECKYLNDTIGKDKLIEWTGNIAFTGFTAPKIMWLKKHEPQNFSRISKIMLPKDYLVYKMSDVCASDVSDNSGTLYFDVKNKKWSKPMLEIMEVREDQLPKIFESYEIVGTVTPAIAKATGLSTTTNVVAGGGDQAVGAISTGTIGEGALSISLGTSGVVFAGSDKYKKSGGGLHSFCHSDGKYHIMGCMLSCAGSIDFWLNTVLKTTDFSSDIASIADANADGLIFLPYLAGERSPINDPDASGSLIGLKLHHTRADIVRAVVEGVCLGLKDCYESIKATGIYAKFAGVTGGGAKSSEWCQILADCLGIEVCTLSTSEGGGLGAVILAMIADGVYKNISSACSSLIKQKEVFKPDKARTCAYDSKFRIYKELYKSISKNY